MEAQEADVKFKQADALYKQGRYAEALELLEAIDQVFPNNKTVLYPKALCLAHLGRHGEAAAACDTLIARFQDPRARALRAKLNVPAAIPGGAENEGLDMSMLDDILGPAPKKAPAPRVAPASSGNKTLLMAIGAAVAVVAVAAAAYYLKPWQMFHRPTLEEVQADLQQSWGKIQSVAAEATMTATMPAGQMKMDLNGTGNIQFLKTAAAPMFRVDLGVSMKMGPQPMDQHVLIVSDGKAVFLEMNMMGQPMVMKSDKGAIPGMDMAGGVNILDELKKVCTVTLLRDEVVDGKNSYALDMVPKQAAQGMPVGKLKLNLAKDNGLPLKFVVQDPKGGPPTTIVFKNVVVNGDIAADQFKYTPPAGVKVMDATDLQKMAPMFGGPQQ